MKLITKSTFVALLTFCLCNGQNNKKVGEGCTNDEECVKSAYCNTNSTLCDCPAGFRPLGDQSKCLNITQVIETSVNCISTACSSDELDGHSRCLAISASSKRCICDPGHTLKNSKCRLPCRPDDHVFCAQKKPTTVCLKLNDTEETFCLRRECQMTANCADILGAQCLPAPFNPLKAFCQVDAGGDVVSDDDEDDILQLEKDFSMYLTLALTSISMGMGMTISCMVCIMTGKCSGSLRGRVPKGRGIPFILKRVPFFNRRLPRTPSVAKARTPSAGSIKPPSRQPSVSNVKSAASRSSISSIKPKASTSYVESTVDSSMSVDPSSRMEPSSSAARSSSAAPSTTSLRK